MPDPRKKPREFELSRCRRVVADPTADLSPLRRAASSFHPSLHPFVLTTSRSNPPSTVVTFLTLFHHNSKRLQRFPAHILPSKFQPHAEWKERCRGKESLLQNWIACLASSAVSPLCKPCLARHRESVSKSVGDIIPAARAPLGLRQLRLFHLLCDAGLAASKIPLSLSPSVPASPCQAGLSLQHRSISLRHGVRVLP